MKENIKSVCLLVSGDLGYLILQFVHSKYMISAVFTNKKSDSIIEFCKDKDIVNFIGNPRGGKTRAFIKKIESDIILSVNYLFLIEEDLIEHVRLYAINIHGSLLPKYRGRTPHVWAIINGENTTGITAHLIDSKMDNGDIIKQVSVVISEDDTGGSILEKFSSLYLKLVNEVLISIENGTISFKKQDISKATYYGKRTPESGRINWEWDKFRIGNWIRAQAKPYPGAFTFYDENKITIHKSTFSDLGYPANTQNGTILLVSEKNLYVKTTNGCLKLSSIEKGNNQIDFKIGKVLK